MGAKINCSICGKPADSAMENCPHCGSPITVGRQSAPLTPAMSVSVPADACPSCGASVQEGDIVCVRCGVNLLTGHKVVKQQQGEAVSTARGGRTRNVLFGLLAAGIVIAAGVILFVVLRDPVKEARQLAKSGDLLGAINLLQKHTDNSPEDVAAFSLLGRLYMQTQQYPDAASSFDTAARLSPADEQLSLLAVLAAGKIPGEAGEQRQIAALERLVENQPNNTQAVKMLALAQGASGAADQSTATLSALQAAGEAAGEVAKFQGIVLAIAGKYSEARAALSEAEESDTDVRLARGYVSSLEGDQFAAADALSAAVGGSAAADPEAQTRLGLLHMAQGNFDLALPLLRPAEGSHPSESARFFYALCLQTAGLEDEALVDFERLVSAEGKFAEDAAIQMAMIYLKRDQLDRAAESTRKARKFGSSARLFTVEGQIAAIQGDDTGAQDLYRKAIGADDAYPAAHLEQGLMYVRRGVLAEGIRELKRYLELAAAAAPGGRVEEVDLLVKQLEQAADRDSASS